MGLVVQGDVHVEHGGRLDLDALRPDDTLVLAGDFCPFVLTDEWLPHLRDAARRVHDVVWVPGNHEYYGAGDMDEALDGARRRLPDNVALRDLDHFRLADGRSCSACTLWSREPDTSLAKYVNDFRCIGGLTPELYNELHAVHLEWLQVNPAEVVVTHHAPLKTGTSPPQYRDSPTNGYFASNALFTIAEPPVLWVFGHTHHSSAQQLGRTRVVSSYGKLMRL